MFLLCSSFFLLQEWGRINARTAVNVTGGRGAWRCTDIVTQVWNDSSVTCASHDSAWKRSWPSTFTATSGKNRTSAISAVANMANVTNWRRTNAGTHPRRGSTDRSPTPSPRSSSSIQNRPTSRSIRVQRVGDTVSVQQHYSAYNRYSSFSHSRINNARNMLQVLSNCEGIDVESRPW